MRGEGIYLQGASPKTPRRLARRLALPAAQRGALCPVDHPHRGPLLSFSHDGPIRHQKRGYILMTDQSGRVRTRAK
eukprot:4108514-Pyramimonas_sp.AAC.2